MERKSLVRSTSAFLAVGAALLLMIVGSMVYLVYGTQNYVDGAARARQLRSASADLLLAIQDAETGQRGYLLTQNEAFLNPYIESIGTLERREAAFELALATADFISIDSEAITATIGRKIAELRRTIALAQSQRMNEAMDVVRDESGLRLMGDIRNSLTGLIELSDTRIAEQFASNLRLAALLRITTIAGVVGVLAVMIAVVLVIRRYIDEITEARLKLQDMNAGLEERVRERTEDLIQANQEIQRFAYIVTHDLRAPLVNIMGFTAELESALSSIRTYFKGNGGMPGEDGLKEAQLAVDEDLPEAIGFIRTSTRKMDNLINAILKISRDGRRPLKPEDIDLDELIRNSAAVIQHQVIDADGDVSISVKVKRFVSDRFSIEQMLGNLFDNAVKYRDTSRPLTLTIRAYPVNRFTIAIDVTDNGRGIAPEDHDRIFELFRRAGAQDSPGEGIGLAHVRSLTRNMGGDITVKSELGRGTTFMIRLPVDLSQYVRSHGQ